MSQCGEANPLRHGNPRWQFYCELLTALECSTLRQRRKLRFISSGNAMSDQSSADIRATRRDFITEHREMYLRSGGTEGHIVDITAVGGHSFTTHCLIKYTGRKSGKIFITPLIYGDIGGEVVIVASKGGADSHPAWYLNIKDSTTLDFQIATQAFRASWREPRGAERDKVWSFMVDVFPAYAKYQASTAREIPLVMMKALEPIAVFKESDATGARQF
jgi:deazaflavin-dependent oxidoreductase (nitroreductase family)